jgi:methionine-rich copper-binding protein CopC
MRRLKVFLPTLRRWMIGGIATAAVALASTAASHALLVDSIPKPDEVTTSPPELVLRFNGRIEKRLSSVTLVGGTGNTKVLLLASGTDGRPDTLRFALPALEQGIYHAEWKVLSVDGHFTGGVMRFTVVFRGSKTTR